MGGARAGGARDVLGNRTLASLIAAHLLAVIAEYAAYVGVLVDAFERGGPRVTGLASIATLLPTMLAAPLAAWLTSQLRPATVRRAGLAVQAIAYVVAGLAAAADLPVAVVVAATVVALGALTTLRPTGAVLMPAAVRTGTELTTGSLLLTYCEGASALVGPLVAAGLLALGDPAAVLLGGGALTLAATLLSTGHARREAPAAPDDEREGMRAVARQALGLLRGRPWTTGVLGTLLARFAVLGAFDVLLVVLALDELDLGGSGAGLLNALLGGGALLSTVVAAGVVRRTRLAPWIAGSLALSAAVCGALALVTSLPVAIVVLPASGLAGALIDGFGRLLLQRSADPRSLGTVFAVVEVTSGIGMLLGSAVAQVLVVVSGVPLALAGVGALLAVVLLASWSSLRFADEGADVPVVEMSLLRALPVFAPLEPLALEAVARSATHVRAGAGEAVVRQGEEGDTFYAVVSGDFDVVVSGQHVRVASRGSCFGEVALLADVPRTATVSTREGGELLAIDRGPFLLAVTGSESARTAAWHVIGSMAFVPDARPPAVES